MNFCKMEIRLTSFKEISFGISLNDLPVPVHDARVVSEEEIGYVILLSPKQA